MLRVNVDEFKEVIKKATLANSIDSVRLEFKDGRVLSGMRTEDKQGIIYLDMPNNIIENLKEEVEFNFSEPGKLVVPYLNLIDEEQADIEIKEDSITIKSGSQKSRLSFCSPMVVSTFERKRKEVKHFLEMDINDDFMDYFNKIKKIGTRYGKIYFSVENGKFFMESADKQNKYSPTLKFAIEKTESKDLDMCFNFRHFVNMMVVINDEEEHFKLKFTFLEKDDIRLGMIHAEKSDNSENYYLTSVVEDV